MLQFYQSLPLSSFSSTFQSLFCGLFAKRIPWITFYLGCQVKLWPKNHILPLIILRSALCCTCTKIEMHVLANMKKSCWVHSFYSAKACLVLIIDKKARYMHVYNLHMLVCHICCLNFKRTAEHVWTRVWMWNWTCTSHVLHMHLHSLFLNTSSERGLLF